MVTKYKDRTIEALKKLGEKFKNPHGKRFNVHSECPLCDIYYNSDKNAGFCDGCIFSDEKFSCGCTDSDYYREIKRYLKISGRFAVERVPELFYEVSDVFGKSVIVCLDIPDRYFTPSGWRYDKFWKIRELFKI